MDKQTYNQDKGTNVVLVQLIFRKQHLCFGSISAIFDWITEEDLGIKKSTLLHGHLKDRDICTSKAIIRQRTLLRKQKK